MSSKPRKPRAVPQSAGNEPAAGSPRAAWPRFADLRGQDRAVSLLRRALDADRIHHAYLFEGPDGVGKELAARALAARLMCLKRAGTAGDSAAALFGDAADGEVPLDACGSCDSCRLLAADTHPDFHFVDRSLNRLHPDRSIRASKGLFLVVGLVRHFLIEPLANRPSLSPRRVCIVRDAERMNEEAQNALLKTLEEPPGATCLILVSSSATRLLPTIRSRCQRVTFAPLPSAMIVERLKSVSASENDADAIAAMAQGRLGAALLWRRVGLIDVLDGVGTSLSEGLPKRPEAFGKRLLELAEGLAGRISDPARAADAAVDAAEPDEDALDESEPGARKAGAKSVETDELRGALRLVLMCLASVYREAIRHQAGAARTAAPRQEAIIARLATLDSDRLADGVQAIARCESMIDRNVAPALCLEWLAIALTSPSQEALHV